MAWAMIIDGRVFIYWFNIGVRENSELYVNKVLEGFMWPILLTMPNRRNYWFQQDGARCHTSNLSLEWIRKKKLTDKVRLQILELLKTLISVPPFIS